MRKFAKPILITLGAIVALYAFAIAGVNLYLQSKGVQERIRIASSEAAGVPVEIRSTCYLPWSGLRVSGVAVPHDGGGRLPLLHVGSISVQFQLLALLQGRFGVKEILVDHPTLMTFQKKDGTWSRPATFARDRPAVPSASPLPGDVVSPSASPAPEATPPSFVAPPARPAVSLERVRIRNGTVSLNDSLGRRMGFFEGIEVTVKPAPDGTASGKFKIRESSWLDKIVVQDIRGTFFWRRDHFEILGFEGKWAEGSLSGRLAMDWGSDPRFSASAKVADVSLRTLAEDAGMRTDGTEGTLFGSGELAGSTGRPETFAGGAQIELKSARFEPVDFVRQIGDLMSIEELQMLELKEAKADFSVADERVMAKKIVLESKNLAIEASGPAGFDGKLALEARLLVNDKLRRDLRALIGKSLVASDRQGYMSLPFSVTGTVSRPESNLLDKIAGVKISRDVGNLLQNLLRLPAAKTQKAPAPDAAQPKAE